MGGQKDVFGPEYFFTCDAILSFDLQLNNQYNLAYSRIFPVLYIFSRKLGPGFFF